MVLMSDAFYDGLLYVYPEGLGDDFLTFLGFTINPKLTPLIEKPGEQVTVSEEKLDVIDADVTLFATEKPEDIDGLKKVKTFKFLKAVEGKHVVYTDPILSGAMYFLTPLAFDYILEKLPPSERAPAESWIKQAQARTAAIDASRRLAADALAGLGK